MWHLYSHRCDVVIDVTSHLCDIYMWHHSHTCDITSVWRLDVTSQSWMWHHSHRCDMTFVWRHIMRHLHSHRCDDFYTVRCDTVTDVMSVMSHSSVGNSASESIGSGGLLAQLATAVSVMWPLWQSQAVTPSNLWHTCDVWSHLRICDISVMCHTSVHFFDLPHICNVLHICDVSHICDVPHICVVLHICDVLWWVTHLWCATHLWCVTHV